MVSWLVGWLAGWLVSWLVGREAGGGALTPRFLVRVADTAGCFCVIVSPCDTPRNGRVSVVRPPPRGGRKPLYFSRPLPLDLLCVGGDRWDFIIRSFTGKATTIDSLTGGIRCRCRFLLRRFLRGGCVAAVAATAATATTVAGGSTVLRLFTAA